MRNEYKQVLNTAKHALCTVGVKGKDSIDRLLGCIIALQEDNMDVERLSTIIDTLNNVTVGGPPQNLSLFYDVITILEQVRDGTFDVSQIDEQVTEGEVVNDG